MVDKTLKVEQHKPHYKPNSVPLNTSGIRRATLSKIQRRVMKKEKGKKNWLSYEQIRGNLTQIFHRS
jgi:hypothetical protein